MANKYKLTKENINKVLKGAAISVSGAVLVVLSESLLSFDYGDWTPAVYAVVPVLVNIVRKFLSEE